jgi:hypothetical protein
MTYEENTGSVGGVTAPFPPFTSSTGPLRGPTSLQGGIASRPIVSGPGSDSAVVADPQLVNGQEADSDLGLYLDFNSPTLSFPGGPQPIRGGRGGTDPGPRTYAYEKLNPDIYAPPGTDNGDVPNAMWPLGLSHNRAGIGKESGWARQQNVDVLPAATAMAGVDMRLAPNAYRELHWHQSAEWYVIPFMLESLHPY